MASEGDQMKAILPFMQVCALLLRDGPVVLASGAAPDTCDAEVQRADEIEKMEPKMAYYCRMYAVDVVRGQ